MGKLWDTAPGVGKPNLRCRYSWNCLWGSPGLQGAWGRLVLRILVTQAPLSCAEELRMEWGPAGWIQPGAEGESGAGELWVLWG